MKEGKRKFVLGKMLTLLMLLGFTACGSDSKADENFQVEENVQSETDRISAEQTQNNEVYTEKKIIEEVKEEADIIVQEKEEAYETAQEWIDSLEFDEMKLLVFNLEEGNQIISDGESYQLKASDELYAYAPTRIIHGCSIDFGLLLGTEIGEHYIKLKPSFTGTTDIRIALSSDSNLSDYEYSMIVTLTEP